MVIQQRFNFRLKRNVCIKINNRPLDELDIDECKNYKCGGRCINLPGTYQCECDKGYRLEGDRCVDMDECLSNPCQGRCINLVGSFRCECDEGYTTERHLCIGTHFLTNKKKRLML